MRWLFVPIALIQVVLGLRVARRLVETRHGRMLPADPHPAPANSVSLLVPVLNESQRLGPCLDKLIAQGHEIAEILVADGGSDDGTVDLVHAARERDSRIRLIDATPVPPLINGKAHNLEQARLAAAPGTEWICTIDADVRAAPGLIRAALQVAREEQVDLLSVATRQSLSGPAEAIVHPSMLTTLVYRFGIPGSATANVDRVQANGQCMLIRKSLLDELGGFGSVQRSICEDVTLARAAAAGGHRAGFFEGGELAEVQMYASWRETWSNWSRSLPMQDRYAGPASYLGLVEVTLVQGLPLAAVLTRAGGRVFQSVNRALLLMRLGTLAGMARAYPSRPWTYWLSPVADLAVAAKLWKSLFQRQHIWRNRPIARGDTV